MTSPAIIQSKDELQVHNCATEAILQVENVTDITHPTGPLRANSVFNISWTTTEDTKHLDPINITISIDIQKSLFFGWYARIPNWVIDEIGERMMDSTMSYLGNNTLRVPCFFKDKYGQCFPPKGRYSSVVDLGDVFNEMKQSYGSMLTLANGWYKLKLHGSTDQIRKDLFCVSMEFKLNIF